MLVVRCSRPLLGLVCRTPVSRLAASLPVSSFSSSSNHFDLDAELESLLGNSSPSTLGSSSISSSSSTIASAFSVRVVGISEDVTANVSATCLRSNLNLKLRGSPSSRRFCSIHRDARVRPQELPCLQTSTGRRVCGRFAAPQRSAIARKCSRSAPHRTDGLVVSIALRCRRPVKNLFNSPHTFSTFPPVPNLAFPSSPPPPRSCRQSRGPVTPLPFLRWMQTSSLC